MEESATYSLNPNPSPKSRHRRTSSRFKPEDSNNSNKAASLPYRDQPTTSTPDRLNVEDLSDLGFRRGVPPLSTRNLVM